jgi:hypothetical protein
MVSQAAGCRWIGCVVASAVASCAAWGQYSCEEPLAVVEGVNPTATLLSLPSYVTDVFPCHDGNDFELHHAVYHSFTAVEAGWYSASVLTPLSEPWRPHLVVSTGCGEGVDELFGGVMHVYANDVGDACGSGGYRLASVTFEMSAGESRILVVGGEGSNDAGPANLLIERLGSTPMEGAQELFVGSNEFEAAALEPSIRYADVCSWWQYDRMNTASRFTFTPPKSGTYRIGFCGSQRNQVALSSSPFFPSSDLVQEGGNCPSAGGRLTTALDAGVTYYVVAGFQWGNYDECQTRTATVEYIDPCPADLTGDGEVAGGDLGIMLIGWGTPLGDITGDGITDGLDISFLIGAWGPCPE